jgi:hypothetical protein
MPVLQIDGKIIAYLDDTTAMELLECAKAGPGAVGGGPAKFQTSTRDDRARPSRPKFNFNLTLEFPQSRAGQ